MHAGVPAHKNTTVTASTWGATRLHWPPVITHEVSSVIHCGSLDSLIVLVVMLPLYPTVIVPPKCHIDGNCIVKSLVGSISRSLYSLLEYEIKLPHTLCNEEPSAHPSGKEVATVTSPLTDMTFP